MPHYPYGHLYNVAKNIVHAAEVPNEISCLLFLRTDFGNETFLK
jgi:hypothetical protein